MVLLESVFVVHKMNKITMIIQRIVNYWFPFHFLDSCYACYALSWRLALKLSRSNSDKKIKKKIDLSLASHGSWATSDTD